MGLGARCLPTTSFVHKGKTAALIACCVEGAATECSENQPAAALFGEKLGPAFQVKDDI